MTYMQPFGRPTRMEDTMNKLLSGNIAINNGPAVDIYRDKDGVKIEIELAGVPKENVEISCADNLLTVKVSKPTPERPEGTVVLSAQRGFGELKMEFGLEDIDISKIEADMKDSVLLIKLPAKQKEEKKTTTIVVK